MVVKKQILATQGGPAAAAPAAVPAAVPLPSRLPDQLPRCALCSKMAFDPSGSLFCMTPIEDRGFECIGAHFERPLSRIMVGPF